MRPNRPYDRAVERIADQCRNLATSRDRASEKHAHDYAVARDATFDVLVLVLAGQLTDDGMDPVAARKAARDQATGLTEIAGGGT